MPSSLERRIMALEKEHRLVSDNLIDAIWTLDVKTQTFDYITPSIEKISGFTPEEYLKKPLKERLTPASYEKVISILAEETAAFGEGTKNVRKIEVELIHKNGSVYWGEIRSRLIREKGKPLKAIGVTREITDLKKAEQAQNALVEKLQKTLAEKEKLMAEIKVLRGLLPICSGCGRIRDEKEKWWPLGAYVKEKTGADFTHTICPDCKDIFYGDL